MSAAPHAANAVAPKAAAPKSVAAAKRIRAAAPAGQVPAKKKSQPIFRKLPLKRLIRSKVHRYYGDISAPESTARVVRAPKQSDKKIRLNSGAMDLIEEVLINEIRTLFQDAINKRTAESLTGNDIRRVLEFRNDSVSKDALARLKNHEFDEPVKKRKAVKAGAAAPVAGGAAQVPAGAQVAGVVKSRNA